MAQGSLGPRLAWFKVQARKAVRFKVQAIKAVQFQVQPKLRFGSKVQAKRAIRFRFTPKKKFTRSNQFGCAQLFPRAVRDWGRRG